ncbi:SURF1 family protein [Chelatococcus sp. SYSU_G07232]|uniref:SURF1-like protein n=1 Tax=Chelatococcus albus TaxID=3047466 RepID=A0ABT7AER4_9HYPH|nr:SURF1 family protein [Chelatococcus sp. SYSU_G07232]MDJ1157857.1 SURF1 family protein [Chelatococcus sp. SYSU_G07232]
MPRLRPLLLPGLLTLAALAVLLSLGTWQLGRKAWKDELLARIEARIHATPGEIVREEEWPAWKVAEDEYRRARLTGTFRHDAEVLVHGNSPRDPRSGSVLPGYYVLTPLVRDDGTTVIVNRGFVPLDRRAPDTRPDGQVAGAVTVTGVVRAPEEGGWFVPQNDAAKGEWFTRDVAAIAAAKKLQRVAPFYVDADAAPNPGGWPRGGLTVVNFPNNHLEYALTWYGLAVGAAGVFIAWAWRRLRGA